MMSKKITIQRFHLVNLMKMKKKILSTALGLVS